MILLAPQERVEEEGCWLEGWFQVSLSGERGWQCEFETYEMGEGG